VSLLDIIIKEQLGASQSFDPSDVPRPYRFPTPITNGGVPPTTPVGAISPIDSQVSIFPPPE